MNSVNWQVDTASLPDWFVTSCPELIPHVDQWRPLTVARHPMLVVKLKDRVGWHVVKSTSVEEVERTHAIAKWFANTVPVSQSVRCSSDNVLIMDWVEDIGWQPKLTHVLALADVLASLHNVDWHAVKPVSSAVVNELDVSVLTKNQAKQYQHALKNIQAQPSQLTLVHGDLTVGNVIVQQQQLWLIDWEYCRVADFRWDIVTIMIEFELKGELAETFLQRYSSQRGLNLAEWRGLVLAWQVIYATTCLVWTQQNDVCSKRYLAVLETLNAA